MEVFVEMDAAPNQKMDIESIARLEKPLVEEGLTFLEKQIFGGRAENDFVGLGRDRVLNDLGLQNASGDSRQINAEERFAAGENPMPDKASNRRIITKFELTKTEDLPKRLDAGPDRRLDFRRAGQCGRGRR